MSEYVPPDFYDPPQDDDPTPVDVPQHAEAIAEVTFDRPGIGSGRARMSFLSRVLHGTLRGPADIVEAMVDGAWDAVLASTLGFGLGFGLGWASGATGYWAWTTSRGLGHAIGNTILTTVGIGIAGEVATTAIVSGSSETFEQYFREATSYGRWAGAGAYGAWKAYTTVPDLPDSAGSHAIRLGQRVGAAGRRSGGLRRLGLGPVFIGR